MSIKVAADTRSVGGEEEEDDVADAEGDEGEGDEGDEEGLLENEEGSNEENVSMQWFGGREERKFLFQVNVSMHSDRTTR